MANKWRERYRQLPVERRGQIEAEVAELRRELPLHELRRARQFSQEQLAQVLGEKQASISKLEQRTDMYVSTLRRYLEAMGGELVIAARFPAGAIEISQFGELAPAGQDELETQQGHGGVPSHSAEKRVGTGRARAPHPSGKYGGGHVTKSTRNTGKAWQKQDVKQLKQLARENTPTRVIGLKLGRTPGAVQNKASQEGVSLKPTNQSPYNRKKR